MTDIENSHPLIAVPSESLTYLQLIQLQQLLSPTPMTQPQIIPIPQAPIDLRNYCDATYESLFGPSDIFPDLLESQTTTIATHIQITNDNTCQEIIPNLTANIQVSLPTINNVKKRSMILQKLKTDPVYQKMRNKHVAILKFIAKQAAISPIAASITGYSTTKMYYRHTKKTRPLEAAFKVLPIHYGRKTQLPRSPLIHQVPLSQYLTPKEPLILPPILFRPNQKDHQTPIWVRNKKGTHIDIMRNVPIPIDFTEHTTCPDDFLVFHMTVTPKSHYGPTVQTCTLAKHQNKAKSSCPFYIEAAIPGAPWIQHLDHFVTEGHHYYRTRTLIDVNTIYLAFPCSTSCQTQAQVTTSPYWYFHVQGRLKGELVDQTFPLQVKQRTLMPPMPHEIDPVKHPLEYRFAESIYQTPSAILTPLIPIHSPSEEDMPIM